MRTTTLAIVAASAWMLACGPKPSTVNPSPASDQKVVGWETTDDDPAALLSGFDVLSRKHSCTTTAKGDTILAECSEGSMIMIAQGHKITIGCKEITLEACHALFSAIADEGADAAPPPDPDKLVVVASQELGQDDVDSAIPRYEHAAKKAGCTVVSSNATTDIVQCAEGRAAATVNSKTLVLACLGMTDPDCRKLQSRIIEGF